MLGINKSKFQFSSRNLAAADVGENDCVQLISRNGTGWTERDPLDRRGCLKMRQTHFVIDAGALVLELSGILRRQRARKHDHFDQFNAFDVPAMAGGHLRWLDRAEAAGWS